MTGQRKLHVVQNWPGVDETVWVPLLALPWRDDEQDRIPTDTEKAS